GSPMGHAVVGELAPHPPLVDAGVIAVFPNPAPMQVARLRTDADASKVHAFTERLAAEVDREPTPHRRAAPASRSPRFVAVAAGVGPLMTRAAGLEPTRPPAGLFEMTLAHALARLDARAAAFGVLPVGSDQRRERIEGHVHRDVLGRRGQAP